jgi:hypothetical protein
MAKNRTASGPWYMATWRWASLEPAAMAFRWPELTVEALGGGGEHGEAYRGVGEVWCGRN